ncbi:MAG: hypothetical protein M3Q45_06880, partial [Chloroflexota bacterium]|nr:hypothetical protein [Chloroflexota bacterium]
LAAALIWPIVAQLMTRVGHRHVSQVVALFATGSYATDLTRSVEDATAYAALSELEVLTGVRRPVAEQDALMMRTLIDSVAPRMAEMVGKPLFDTIYLLDREKSNQGLALDSHELAVVAANALEALTVAGGNLLIQEQLGYGLYGAEPRPYSLIGAAGDYVPVTHLLHAVNRQEESRLVREQVLRTLAREATAEADLADPPADSASLTQLGLTQAEALAQLLPRLPNFQTRQPVDSIEALAVREAFVLPKPVALDWRRTPDLIWAETLQTHVDQFADEVKLTTSAQVLDEAWGAQGVAIAGTWTQHKDDDRLLPRTVTGMQRALLAILAASPVGLTNVQIQIKRWLREIEAARQEVWSVATPNARHLAQAQRQLALRNWTANYAQAVTKTPPLSTIRVRALLAVLVIVVLTFGALWLVGRAWNPFANGLSVLGLAVAGVVISLVVYRTAHNRVRSLRGARIVLAQSELTAHLQAGVADGLVRSYDRLADLLKSWSQMMGEAAGELNTLSTPPAMPAVPPPGVMPIPLYQPHLSRHLWERCLAYLRTQQDAHGHGSEERLARLWGAPAWREEMQRILGGGAAVSGQSQARTLAQFIRNTVRQAVAPVSLEQPSSAGTRAELMRSLAKDFSIEHLLWRNGEAEAELARRLRAIERGGHPLIGSETTEAAAYRRYVETAWHRAK